MKISTPSLIVPVLVLVDVYSQNMEKLHEEVMQMISSGEVSSNSSWKKSCTSTVMLSTLTLH